MTDPTNAATDPVLAKLPGECCLKSNIHEGEARGTTATIAGVETYVANPPEGKANGNIVLYFPDVHGLFQNGFLVMDGFADAGYLTLGVDFFRGDPVWKHRNGDGTLIEPDFDFAAWRAKHFADASDIVPAWVEAVKERYGKPTTKFACVGYCFGAPYVLDQLAAGGICTAGAVAHPTALKEHHFSNLKKPLFLSCAETDRAFPTESRNRAVDILIKEGKDYQVQLFHGVSHGFALKGDINNPYERYTKEQSLKGMAEWFDFWMSQK